MLWLIPYIRQSEYPIFTKANTRYQCHPIQGTHNMLIVSTQNKIQVRSPEEVLDETP